jgi:hypothetical protein
VSHEAFTAIVTVGVVAIVVLTVAALTVRSWSRPFRDAARFIVRTEGRRRRGRP